MNDQATHRNYLSRLAFTDEKAELRYHRVNLVARAVYPKAGMKNFVTAQVRIVSLNETGAVVQARDLTSLPDHFYICLGMMEIFLTCSKKQERDGSVFVTFSKPEAAAFIQALVKVDFPLATLQRLKGQSSAAIEARIYNAANSNAG